MSNDNFGLDFNFGGNSSELQKLVEQLQRMAKATDSADEAEKKRAVTAQKTLVSLKELVSESDEVRKALKGLESKGIEDQAKQTDLLIQKFDEITAKINKIATAERDLIAATQAESNTIAGLKAQLKELQALRDATKDSNERGKIAGQIDALKASIKEAEAPIAGFSDKLIGIGKEASDFGNKLGPAGAQLSQFGGSVSSLGEALASLGPIGAIAIGITAIASAGVVAGKVLFDITNNISEMAKKTDEVARLVGITREFATALQLASQAGVDPAGLNDLKQGLTDLIERQKEAKSGSEEYKQAFTTFDLTGLESAEVTITKIGQKLNEGGADAGKYALALKKIFGDEGAGQFEVIARNIENAKQKAKEYGLVLSDDVAAKFKELQTTSADFQAKLKGIETIVGGRFVEVFTILEQSISAIVDDLRNNEDIGKAFETLSTVAERLLISLIPIAEFIGKIIALGAKLIATFGDAVGITDKYKASVDGAKASTEQAGQAADKLGQSYFDLGAAIDGIVKRTSNLNNENQLFIKAAELAAEGQRLFVEEQLKAGLISKENAARAEAKIDDDLNQKKVSNAQKAFSEISKEVSGLTAIAAGSLDAQVKAEESAATRKKAAQEDYNQFKSQSQSEIEAMEQAFAERSAARQKFVADQEISERKNAAAEARRLDQEELAAIEEKKRADLSVGQQKLENLEKANQGQKNAISDRVKAEKNLSDLQLALNDKELVNTSQLTEKSLKLRQAYLAAKNAAAEADQEKDRQRSENAIKIQEAELAAKTRIINQTTERITTALAQQFQAIDEEIKKEHQSFVEGEEDKQRLLAQSFVARKSFLEQELALAKGNAGEEQKIKDQLFALEQARQRQAVTNFANLEKAKTDDAAREIAKRNALTADSQQKEIKNEQEVIRRFSSDRETAIRKVIQLRQELLAAEISVAQRELDLAISLNKPASERIALQTKLNGLRDQEDQLTFALNGRYEKLNDSTRQLIDNIGQAVDRQNELTNATEQTNAAANQTSRSVNDLYKGVGVLQGQFHDTGASLVSDVVEQGKAGIAALAQAEAQAVAQQRAYLQQAYNAIQAAYREAEQSRVDANETANQELLDAQKTYDEKIRKLREDFVKFHKDTERQIVENIFEGLKLIAEETSRNEQNRTAIIKEESDRRKEIETRNANEIFDIIQSINERILGEREAASKREFDAKSSFLDKIAQLENEQRDASTQKEKDAIQKRIDAANAEEQQRLDREARKKAALSALDDEFAAKSKGVTDPEELKKLQAEYEARKKSTEDKFDLEESFQEEYNKLVESGNQKRADELKADYERQKTELDTFLQKQLDNIAANYKHQQELAKAQRIAEETAYQKKLADEQTRHEAEVASIIQREAEKNQKLQDALDDEKRRRKNQREAIENEYRESEKKIRETLQESLDKIQSKLTDALDAAVGRIKSFASNGSSAINGLNAAIDALIAKAQQAIGLTTQLAGGGSSTGSPFNLTSANTTNNVTSTNSPIANPFGNGFTSNVTTEPIDSSDKNSDGNSGDNKNKNKSGKGPVKQANTNKINASPSSNSNLTDSPLSSDDQSGNDGTTGDSNPNKNKNKGSVKQAGEVERSSKGGVSQADSPAIEDRNEPFPPPPDLSGGRNKNKGGDSNGGVVGPRGSGNTNTIINNNSFNSTINLNGSNLTLSDVERTARRVFKEEQRELDRQFKAYE